MSDPGALMRAISDETRFSIMTILLRHDICTGAIARRLEITDAAVSQHMKVLREAGLVVPERRGYFVHYTVNREALRWLAVVLDEMAGWDRRPCDPVLEGCTTDRRGRCPADKCRGGCSRVGEGSGCRGCTMFGRRDGSETMKVAVTYENGEIFQHFGRTQQFKVYEIDNGKVVSSEVVGNEGKGHGELVGVLRQLGVSTLICGGLGAGARQGLEASGIRVCSGNTGSADVAAEKFANGTLEMCSQANCDHHGGDHQCSCGRH